MGISELRINYTQSYTTETVAKIANIEYLIANNITAPYIQYLSDSRIKNDINLLMTPKLLILLIRLRAKSMDTLIPTTKNTKDNWFYSSRSQRCIT